MCTAANYLTKCHYFGRNFDYEISYNERVCITPRNYPLIFREVGDIKTHQAIIGITAGIDEYPLYYDACNEKGLAMAGLNFPDYCDYKSLDESKINIASFEIIPYILSKANNIQDAKKLLENLNISDEKFSSKLPPSPLHWIISDRNTSIVVESVDEGLNIYDNPVGVLTNNPPFDKQLFNLNNYRALSNKTPENTFGNLDLDVYSRGMGSIGLPGDLSSQSRFVKAAFVRENSVSGDSEKESVSQFFHILASVEQQKGCTLVEQPDKFEYTIYSDCYNTDNGILYYKTYDGPQTSVNMYDEDLESSELINFELK